MNEPNGADNRERDQETGERYRIVEELASAGEGQIGAELRKAEADDDIGERFETAREALVILRQAQDDTLT